MKSEKLPACSFCAYLKKLKVFVRTSFLLLIQNPVHKKSNIPDLNVDGRAPCHVEATL